MTSRYLRCPLVGVEAQVRASELASRWCVWVYSVWRSSLLQLGARHTFFCPVSEAISSPCVTINAYRDTAPCLKLQICAAEEERSHLPSGNVLKIGILTLHLLVSILVYHPPGGSRHVALLFIIIFFSLRTDLGNRGVQLALKSPVL